MGTRPTGNVKIWAEDVTYVGGDYSGQDTKLEPSDAIKARGWHPGKRRPAKWDNWLLNDITTRLDNLDMAEALNWPEPAPDAGVIATGGTNSGAMCQRRFAGAAVQQFHVNGDAIIQASVDGGYSWATSHTDAGAVIYDIAAGIADAGAVAAVATEGGAAKVIASVIVGGWNTAALVSVTDARTIVADPYRENVFYVGGVDTATPRVVKLDCSAGLPGVQTLLSGGGGAARVDLLAVGLTHVLGAIPGVASATNVLRRFAYDAAAMTAVTSPTSDAIVDILWNEEDEHFYLFTADAVWRSTTGDTGSWTDMSAGLLSGVTFLLRGGVCRGGLIVCAVTATGSEPHLLVSGDAGETWDLVPDPLARHTGTAEATYVRNIGNRLVVLGYAGGGDVKVAYGLRAGRMS
jgi:hypothetical protein